MRTELPAGFVRLRDHQVEVIEQIVEAFDSSDLVLLEAPTGCLGGDTMLTLNRGGRGFRLPIRSLFEKLNGRRDEGKGWDLTIPTRIAQGDLDTMTIRSSRLAAVTYSGVRPTKLYRIWDGKAIRLTDDHLVMTPDGWRQAGALTDGDQVLVNVGRRKRGVRKPKSQYPMIQGLKGHPRANAPVMRMPTHILVAEAAMNDMDLEDYVAALRQGRSDFAFVGRDKNVHHVDGDSQNFRLSNLQVLDAAEHHRLHADIANVAERLSFRAIRTIVDCGQEMTFDVQMAEGGPHFLAEGVFVHNSGKSLIGEMVRRELSSRAIYLCHSKSLQHQFTEDFPHASVLMGRSNYPTVFADFPTVTAADCTKERIDIPACDNCDPEDEGDALHCDFCCTEVARCPYEVAKDAAVSSDLACTNYSYFLNETNHLGPRSKLSGWPLVVADEADRIEEELTHLIEVSISPRQQKRLGLLPPEKKTVPESWLEWVPYAEQVVRDARSKVKGDSLQAARQYRSLTRMAESIRFLASIIESDNAVYTGYDNGWIKFRPIRVNELGAQWFWNHGVKFLCMSATIISPDQFVDELGWQGPYTSLPSMRGVFPVANRPINVATVGSMSRKNQEETRPRMLRAIRFLLNTHHFNDRVLIHTHSYSLARYLYDNLDVGGRLYSYFSADQRDETIAAFKRNERGVIIAPSMERGVNLPDDLCRAIIVAKVPFPNIGDKQVSARLHAPGGRGWYDVQTVRSIVQSTGRGVRHAEDWCTSWVLDADFHRIYKKGRRLIPRWWSEALRFSGPWLKQVKEAANGMDG